LYGKIESGVEIIGQIKILGTGFSFAEGVVLKRDIWGKNAPS